MTFSISGLGPLPFDPAAPIQISGVEQLGVPFHDLIDNNAATEAPRRDRQDPADDRRDFASEDDVRADDAEKLRGERGADRDDGEDARADDDRGERHAHEDHDRRDDGDADEQRAERPGSDADGDADTQTETRDGGSEQGDDAAASAEQGDGEPTAEAAQDSTDDGIAVPADTTASHTTGHDPAVVKAALREGANLTDHGQENLADTGAVAVAPTATAGNGEHAADPVAEQLALLAQFGIAPAGMTSTGDVLPELANPGEDGEPGIDLRMALTRLLARNNDGGNGQAGNHRGGQAANPFAAALQAGGAMPQPGPEAIMTNRPAADPQLQALPAQTARAMPAPTASVAVPTASMPTADGAAASQAGTGAPQGSDPLGAAKASGQATPVAARPQALSTSAGIQVAIQLSRAIQDGFDRLSVRLNPPELGRVDIKLEVAHDGRAMAMISADRQETLDLLQRDSRGLERALQEAGLRADSGSLSFNLRNQGDGERQGDGNGKNGQLAGAEGDEEDGQALPQIASDRVLDISV